jgi:hypothetical protein
MGTTSTGLATGSLTIQKYNNFRGVDFTDEMTSSYRSPDALNMWKNYKTLGKKIETRPGLELKLNLENTIYGMIFYTINNIDHLIIHSGTKLYDYNPSNKTLNILKENGMNPINSVFFIYNNILFIKDGINYLEYNGATLSDVVGTIPIVSIHNLNTSKTEAYQDINLLSDYQKEQFLPDGTTTEYKLSFDYVSNIKVYLNDVELTEGFTTDNTKGIITFTTAPEKNISRATIVIEYQKTISGNAEKIKKCTLACVFDKRVFFAGNQDYPNIIYWCGLDDPRYIGDTDSYAKEGTDISLIKALVPGNNALWVFKEPSQANTTVFYHIPSTVYDERLKQNVKTYPESHSSITTGCVATGINFNDDIVFFSDRGMEGISGNVTTEQIISHRSSLIDRKLLNETNYNDLNLVEHDGYLFVIVDNIVYLADSRQKIMNNDHIEYEWFYFDLEEKINISLEHKGILYLCSKEKNVLDSKGYFKYTDGTDIYWYDKTNNQLYDSSYSISSKTISTLTPVIISGIYTLTNTSEVRNITSYWTTPKEDCGYPQMLKMTNKKGFKCDINGSSILVQVKKDNEDYENIGTFNANSGYIVTKLKEKKWNKIQLKFSSKLPFEIYDISMENYIGSYVKR